MTWGRSGKFANALTSSSTNNRVRRTNGKLRVLSIAEGNQLHIYIICIERLCSLRSKRSIEDREIPILPVVERSAERIKIVAMMNCCKHSNWQCVHQLLIRQKNLLHLQLTTKTVQGLSLSLQRIDHVHGRDRLTSGVFGVSDGIADDILQEDLEDTTSFFVDETGNTLDTPTTSQTTGLVIPWILSRRTLR